MHPKDDMLRSMIDRELSGAQSQQVREHLTRCPACQGRLAEIQRRATRVQGQMDFLAPGPREPQRAPHVAYTRFTSNSRLFRQQKETFQSMFTRLFTRRPVWTALTILVVLGLAFSLPPVQALAGNFLSLFRVQQITVVQFDPSAAQNSRGALEANQALIEQVFKDDLKIDGKAEPQPVANLAEATNLAGYSPRLPSAISGEAKLAVQPAFKAQFTIDQPKLQELMDTLGVDVQLPASVNGKVATAEMSNVVFATYGCPAANPNSAMKDCTALVQMPSPVINTPDGLDVPRLGQALFQFLGMPADDARALSQRIDWATTLVIPIPQSGSMQYQDVQVDGVSATLFESSDPDEPGYMLMWVKDGVIYSLRGPESGQTGLKIANSLK